MSKLDELIDSLCPDGVEYKSLGDLCNITTGKLNANARKENGKYPFFTCNEEPYLIDEYAFDMEAILLSGNGNIGHINYYKGKFNAYQRTYILYNFTEVVVGYIIHYLKYKFRKYALEYTKKGSVPYIVLSTVQNFQIPVPPIEVQREIVRILDKFADSNNGLIALLTAELTARKKQYEYYRDKLLSEQSENTKYVKLGDIATITRGGNFQKKDFCAEGVPCIHYGQIYTKYGLYAQNTFTYISETVAQKSKKATKNDIIMAVTSENIEDVCKCVAWLGNEDIAVSGHTAIIHHNQNAKYLAYYFHTQMFFEQKEKYAHGTKVIEVTPYKLADIVVPIPPLEEQERIVSILDRFDKLCNDLSQGIPAEIEARKKQYEYYCDKLLQFKICNA